MIYRRIGQLSFRSSLYMFGLLLCLGVESGCDLKGHSGFIVFLFFVLTALQFSLLNYVCHFYYYNPSLFLGSRLLCHISSPFLFHLNGQNQTLK